MATHPLPGAKVTAGFGPYPTLAGFHYGIDLATTPGSPIRANRAGLVIRAGWDNNVPSFGWHVRVQSGDLILIYGHMRRMPLVHVGQRVAEGQHIGDEGESGNANGYHLHFEVRKGGTTRDHAVNPVPYLTDPPKPKPPVSASTRLAVGSRGALVKRLQSELLRVFPDYAGRIRSNGGPNGIYGPATQAVVREFQKRVGLHADGIVGTATWAKLARYGITPK